MTDARAHGWPARAMAVAKGVLLLLLLPIIVLLLVLALTWQALTWLWLNIAIWLCWYRRGRRVLFVYSNSPNWQDYIEANLLPRIEDQAVVLNWSERRRWLRGLGPAAVAFRFYGRGKEFNPMAVVFRPWRKARIFRFYKPFLDHKHGRPANLQRVQAELFAHLGLDAS